MYYKKVFVCRTLGILVLRVDTKDNSWYVYKEKFKLSEILDTLKFSKATYMYWKKRFDRKNPDKELEEVLLAIQEEQ